MKLAIDIGNSNIVMGFWQNDQWKHTVRLLTKPDMEGPYYYEKTIRDFLLEKNIKNDAVSQIGISSVVPEINLMIKQALNQIFECEPYLLGPGDFHTIPLNIEKPYEIGSDLVANSFAANALYGKSSLIIDFGTALTFTVVSKTKGIVGVSIAPGLKTAMGALSGNTAQLPNVNLECPESCIGKNTEHAIQAGVTWGYVALVEGMIKRIKNEYDEKLITIATGGLSAVLEPLKNSFDHINKKLTLEGILLITDKMKS